MTHDLLLLATLLQVAVIVLLLLSLTIRRFVYLLLAGRTGRQERSALLAIRTSLHGEIDTTNLRTVLDRSNEDAVVTVVRQLASVLEGESWEALVVVLRESRWFHRMRRYTRSRFWWRRVAAARCLELVGHEEDLPLISDLLRDRSQRVRLAAITILRRVSHDSLIEQVLEQSLCAEPVLQRYLLSVLQHQPRDLADKLLSRLHDDCPVQQATPILRLMADLGDPRFLEPILARCEDPIVEIRTVCAQALSLFPHPRSSAALLRLLDDCAAPVRGAAASALGALVASEACTALRRCLEDDDRDVRMRAGLALRRLGKPGNDALRRAGEQGGCPDPELPRYLLGLSDVAVRECAGAEA